jgi:hypothetical protein
MPPPPAGEKAAGRAQDAIERLRASRQGVSLLGLKSRDLIAEDRR